MSSSFRMARFPTGRILRSAVACGMLAGGLALGTTAHASLTFTFDYSTNTAGVGFDDPTTGAARKAALETAGMRFSAMFGDSFSNSANIVLTATSSDDPLGPGLASAGTAIFYQPDLVFGVSEVVRNKLVSNGATDINGGLNDGGVNVNWGAAWELNPDAPVSNAVYDLYTVLFHEFTHALGFLSQAGENGKSPFDDGTSVADGGTGFFGSWAKYDQYLTNCAGTSLIDTGTGLTKLALYTSAITSAVCFESAEAGSVTLYTPMDYAPGTSVSHLEKVDGNDLALMKFDLGTGPGGARVYNTDELNIITSLGYTRLAAAVPEPGSIALVLAALGGAAFARRRKA